MWFHFSHSSFFFSFPFDIEMLDQEKALLSGLELALGSSLKSSLRCFCINAQQPAR